MITAVTLKAIEVLLDGRDSGFVFQKKDGTSQSGSVLAQKMTSFFSKRGFHGILTHDFRRARQYGLPISANYYQEKAKPVEILKFLGYESATEKYIQFL